MMYLYRWTENRQVIKILPWGFQHFRTFVKKEKRGNKTILYFLGENFTNEC